MMAHNLEDGFNFFIVEKEEEKAKSFCNLL